MRAKCGDQGAFERIYEKHVEGMLMVGVSLLGDRDQASDVVQDVFVKFVEGLDGFELRGRLKGYLSVCVANRARDRLRRLVRQGRVEVGDERVGQVGPADMAVLNEQLERVAEVFGDLPYEQREVISLKLHGGLSFRAIAVELGARLGTVQSRYRYGLDRLRKELDGEV